VTQRFLRFRFIVFHQAGRKTGLIFFFLLPLQRAVQANLESLKSRDTGQSDLYNYNMKELMPIIIRGLRHGLAVPLAASANLIQNGGFEVPVTSPPFPGTEINDWIIATTHKVAQFASSYRPVGEGNYSIQIESGGLPIPFRKRQHVVAW